MPAKKAAAPPPEPDDVAEEAQPEPITHPSAPGYVLQDGQWVQQDEPEPEKSEE